MEDLYDASRTTRQSFYEWRHTLDCHPLRTAPEKVLEMARLVREKFLPGASARVLYQYIRKHLPNEDKCLKGWGKHAFEALCLKNGMQVVFRRFIPKTTQRGEFVFANLIEGIEICEVDRIWFSDISYVFGSNGKLLGYATSLLDAYSRMLLGLAFSKTMHAAVTSSAVLEQALKARKKRTFEQLIFHSDAGSQYIEKDFRLTLNNHNIKSSMAKNCYENPFAEAFNDTLKNHMFHGMYLNSFNQFKEKETFIKNCYNFNKPHSGINGMTPHAFEKLILNLQPCQRTKLKIKVIE